MTNKEIRAQYMKDKSLIFMTFDRAADKLGITTDQLKQALRPIIIKAKLKDWRVEIRLYFAKLLRKLGINRYHFKTRFAVYFIDDDTGEKRLVGIFKSKMYAQMFVMGQIPKMYCHYETHEIKWKM